MSKALILILGLVVCSFAATSFEQVKQIVERDECGIHGMETIRPKLENQIEILKTNPNDLKAKAELLALINDAKQVYDSCNIDKKVQPALGDAVEAAGVGFLLASNCFKDVGIVLLIADSVIQDPTSVTNDIIVLIFLYILGRQGYADCEKFIHFVL